MFSKTILAASALLSMAAAVPLQLQNKRDIVWETKTHWDVTTMHVTTTVWLEPGEAAPTHFGHHHKKPKGTSTIQSTVTVQPAAPSSPPEQSTPYVAPSPTSPAAAPTTWSSPAPADTSTYAPPPAPKPSPTQTGGGSPTGPHGTTYTGDITYYDVGLGSCGYTNNDSENVVAIATGMMAAGNGINPNNNPWCGKTITISYAGQTHTAEVVDTCGGCEGASIDLSPTLFKAVAPNGDGRVHGVEWWFN